MPTNSFVSSYDRISNVLINSVEVSSAQLSNFDLNKGLSVAKKYNALWDTGATNTCVTKRVVEECELKIIGRKNVNTASGEYDAGIYICDLFLPNYVYYQSIIVTECILLHADLLIGMDIINSGDFAVSNKDGQTVFTFRHPSIERIDFVKQLQNPIDTAAKTPGRNDPCFCGSGRKFKHCHGSNK